MDNEQRELAIEALRAHDDFLRTDYEERAQRLNNSLGGLAVDNTPEEIRANHNLLRNFVALLPHYDGKYMHAANVADLRTIQANVIWVPQSDKSEYYGKGYQPYYLLGRRDRKIASDILLAKPRTYTPAGENEDEKIEPPVIGIMKVNRFILDRKLKRNTAIKNEYLTEGEIGKYALNEDGYIFKGKWESMLLHSMMKRVPSNPKYPVFRIKSAYSDYTLSVFNTHDYVRELAGIFRKTDELMELYNSGNPSEQVD